ncbi:ABC transporter ATP-binding protein [Propylenella binzhouense]|uniref:ABC transporter ATP-binding protein n=1 Tax=Propylenella binzhouense TaxID=2555902 RepID=A0A964T0Y5_9HYPH|nr:ABC transporter ATP-binding protein [Propylenella binzhouense]MYZ46336.1 ABC transporter ATP-binding protein [Propylenella binzhouense]
MAGAILSIRNLKADIGTRQGVMRVVDDVSLTIGPGEAVALVGESGCGKSMTALSITKLAPERSVSIVGGEVLLDGRDLVPLSRSEMQALRGNVVGMVFQDPMTFLNPVMAVGSQIANPLRRHMGLRGARLAARVHELIDLVRIPEAARVAKSYPHELSGGMRQRVLIALACSPKLLIADEPTTALDVTIQAQILDVLKSSLKEFGTALLLITHNMGIVADMCDRVYVMYAGRIVEEARVEDIFARPQHPYTRGLLASVLRHDRPPEALKVMTGSVPNLIAPPAGCRFRPRCPNAMAVCATDPPWMVDDRGQGAACWLNSR